MEEKKKKEEEKKEEEVHLSDVVGGSLNILGMKVDLGKLMSMAERPDKLTEDLDRLRSELEKAGGKPIRVGGHIRARTIVGEKTGEWKPAGRRAEKKVTETKLEGELEPLVDVFDEENNVRVLAEVPYHLKEEDIALHYEKRNGAGELVIKGPEGFERRVEIDEKMAGELTGKIKLRSLKSGIVNAELEKG